MSQSSTPAVTDAIYDASSLGRPRMFLLGLQHLFAMFGATVLVPVLTGLSVSATLLFAGLGTLLFHFLSRGKVPAFLGSSFAFIAGYAAIAPNGEAELLPYACLGVACAGLLYPVLAALFRSFGAKLVMRFFPLLRRAGVPEDAARLRGAGCLCVSRGSEPSAFSRPVCGATGRGALWVCLSCAACLLLRDAAPEILLAETSQSGSSSPAITILRGGSCSGPLPTGGSCSGKS